MVDIISSFCRRGRIPHKGGFNGRPRSCKGMFTLITQGLNDENLSFEDRKVLQSIIPDILIDCRSLPPDIQGMKTGSLAGKVAIVDLKTLACNDRYEQQQNPAEIRQTQEAKDYLKRAAEIDTLLGTPVGTKGPMVKEMETFGPTPGRVLAPVVGAFADMSSDVSTLAGTIAVAMTADHLQYFEAGAKEVRGMYLHRIHRAWGHAAHRGWARLLLDRRRDLIHHGGRTTHLPDRHQDAEQEGHANYQYQYPESSYGYSAG